MTYKVIFTASAKADLFAIYDYIFERAGAEIALRFMESIEAYCLGFETFPERGARRDDLRQGLRIIGFRRRATILFDINAQTRAVTIHGIYYAGRNFEDIEGESE